MATKREEENPYLGPYSFKREDKPFFYGRDRETNDLVSMLIAHRVVLLYAQSGAGKTSLLNAALIPRLEDEGFEVLPVAMVRTVIPENQLPGRIRNIFVFNALTCWSEETDDLQPLAGLSFQGYLGDLPHKTDKMELTSPRLLAFDQSEELFTTYHERASERVDFFSQLCEALASDPLLRILIVIREDYLANLDPYSDLLPDLERSRYRLECLRLDAARTAIEQPLERTDTRFAQGVAEELANKLAAIKAEGASGTVIETVGEYVEPVQLQVVCRSLWSRLPADVKLITAAHLEEFGDVTAALQKFYEDAVKKVCAKIRVKEDMLRSLFEFHLITPLGTRGTVFRGKESSEGVPNKAIELLVNEHIIRSEVRANAHWYELTHDRFIEPIRKSNESWRLSFENKRKWRLVAQVAVPLVLILGVIFAGLFWEQRIARSNLEAKLAGSEKQAALDSLALVEAKVRESNFRNELSQARNRTLQDSLKFQSDRSALQNYWQGRGQVDELRKSISAGNAATDDQRIENAFRGVASYLWTRFEKGDKSSLDTLVAILRDSKDIIPEKFGIDRLSRVLFPSPVASDTPWPLTLVYNPEMDLDLDELQYRWRRMSVVMARYNGLPVPMRLKIVKDKTLPEGSFAVALDTNWADNSLMEKDLTFVLRYKKGYVLLDESEIPGSLRPFFDNNKRKWISMRDCLRYGGPWWLVPAWTQPLWMVAKCPSLPIESAVAAGLQNFLFEHPEIVLNPASTEVILREVSADYPNTAKEALIARGGIARLRDDFVEIVWRSGSLQAVEFWLDALSQYPDLDAEDAVSQILRDSIYVSVDRFSLTGEREGGSLGLEYPVSRLTPYEEASDWLRVPKYRIVVELGQSLWNLVYDTVRSSIRPEIMAEIDQSSAQIHSLFGVNRPTVLFREATTRMRPNGYFIRILNVWEKHDAKELDSMNSQKVLRTILARLEHLSFEARPWWITPEDLARLKYPLNPRLTEWLRARYSGNDIKLILRSVVAPMREQESGFEEGTPLEAAEREIQEGHSITQLPWLLGSLPFWTQVYDPLDCQNIARCLERTQRARLNPVSTERFAGDVPELVMEGIEHLGKDSISLAEEFFSKALKRDQVMAETVFLSRYASQASSRAQIAEILEGCKLPPPGSISDFEDKPTRLKRYDAERLLDNYSSLIDSEKVRRLHLYILWSYLYNERWADARVVLNSLLAESAQNRWAAEDSYLLAYWALEMHRWRMTQPADLPSIERLLDTAFAGMNGDEAKKAFYELLRGYKSSKAPKWYSSILVSLADRFPGSFWIAYRLGADLAFKQNEEGPREGLRLIDQAEQNLNSIPADDRQRLQAWLDYSRALAFIRLAEFGPADEQSTNHWSAVAILNKTIASVPQESEGWPSLGNLFSFLSDAYTVVNEIDSARITIDRGLSVGPYNTELLPSKFFLHLALLEPDSAFAASDAFMEAVETPGDSTSALFISAVARILTDHHNAEQSGRSFLYRTKHEYHDYIRMMLYWTLRRAGKEDAARDYIDRRWNDIDPSTWDDRLQEGDFDVWREMLIGYYRQDEQVKIFSYLKSRATYEVSPLKQLGVPYEALCCEAYFYDALFQSVNGDSGTRRERFRESLDKVLATKFYNYYEYHMARYLLSRQRHSR